MARLVRGDEVALSVGVRNRMGKPDLLGQASSLQVAPRELSAPVSQRPHDRFVENVLEHGGGVAERHRGELFAQLILVHLGMVSSPCEEVIDEVTATGPRRQVEVKCAVEAPRA